MSSRRSLKRLRRRGPNYEPPKLNPRRTKDYNKIVQKKLLTDEKDSPDYLNHLIESILGSSKVIEVSQQEDNVDETETYEQAPRVLGEKVVLPISDPFDLQLYALFALFIRAFILGWYKDKLSLFEEDKFVSELIYILHHIERSWTERCKQVDWAKVLFDDLFVIVDSHVRAFERADIVVNTRYSANIGGTERDQFINNFMAFNGHFSLQPPEKESLYSKMLMKYVVMHSIPTAELHSKLSSEFVVTLLNDLVMRNVLENLSENYAMWDIIGSICDSINQPDTETKKESSEGRLIGYAKEKFTKIGQIISRVVAYSTCLLNGNAFFEDFDFFSSSFFKFTSDLLDCAHKFPILNAAIIKIWGTLGQSAKCVHWCSNLIHNVVYTNILTRKNLAKGVEFLRHLMFPTDNEFFMKPRFIPKNAEELEALRLKDKVKIKRLLTEKFSVVGTGLFSTNAELDLALDRFLEVFRYKTINKSLIWQIIDLIFSTLFPELLETSPTNYTHGMNKS